MSLVLYSSSDSEDDLKPTAKRLKPTLPSVHIQLENEVDVYEKGLQTKSTDRTRLFAHERGNWPMSIFAFIPCSSHLDTMIDDLIDSVNGELNTHWKRLEELHISLSKTFPIRFHHIESIRTSLQNELANAMTKFSTRIDTVTILNNEDQSTSFLVLTLDQHRQFAKLIRLVDHVLQEHRYPCYYENPCFHISFAYSTDPQRHEKLISDWQEKCQSILQQYQCQPSAMNVTIDDLRFKAGKRLYHLLNPSN